MIFVFWFRDRLKKPSNPVNQMASGTRMGFGDSTNGWNICLSFCVTHLHKLERVTG